MILQVAIGAGLGAIVGSFLATLVSRWPRGQSVILGRSRCDGCGRILGALELIPIGSWAIALGRCRKCSGRIDPIHPMIELGSAVIGALCAVAFPPFVALLFAVGGWLLLTLAVLDARHFWLPDALTLTLAGLGLTVGEWVLPAPLADRAIGAFVGVTCLFLLSVSYRRLRGRDGLGLGDAKLLGAIGAWIGWQGLPLVLLVASLAALLWIAGRRIAGGRLEATTRVPLGTFLCIAVVPAWWLTLGLLA